MNDKTYLLYPNSRRIHAVLKESFAERLFILHTRKTRRSNKHSTLTKNLILQFFRTIRLSNSLANIPHNYIPFIFAHFKGYKKKANKCARETGGTGERRMAVG